METQNRGGLVLLAAGFAGVAIVTAFVTSLPRDTETAHKDLVAAVRQETPEKSSEVNPPLWQRDLALATETYAPGQAPADVLVSRTANAYLVLSDDSVPEATKEEVINSIVKNAVPQIPEAPTLTLADLNVNNATNLDTYAMLFSFILDRSTAVREYEGATFARAVRERNYDGSPELIEAATVYRDIRNALTRIEVPSELAKEHLAVVNDVGSLAQIVAQMGTWSGDPVAGLAYMGAFESAQRKIMQSLSTLTSKLSGLKPS